MKQVVYRNLSMSELKKNFEELQSKGYSVSLFTDWKNKNINEVWIKSIVENGDSTPTQSELFGARLATQHLHPVESQSAKSATPQLGVVGPWYQRLPHFKMGFRPSSGEELQSEYFVPIEHAYDAIMAVEEMHERITPHLLISEIRTVAADNFWMSPCYKKNSVAIHTTWKQENVVMNLLPLMEAKLAPFKPVPHWSKLFTILPSVLQSRYEKLDDFKKLIKQYDPDGKFRNEFLEKNLFEGP